MLHPVFRNYVLAFTELYWFIVESDDVKKLHTQIEVSQSMDGGGGGGGDLVIHVLTRW